MTDKEIKAIVILKDREYDFDELYCTFRHSFIKQYDKSIDIVLDLIEKQSKEIEELNKKPMFLIKDIYSPKLKEITLQDTEGLIEQGREEVRDKIKAKIEIRKEEKENCKDSIEEKYLLREIYVLQSLLEKE